MSAPLNLEAANLLDLLGRFGGGGEDGGVLFAVFAFFFGVPARPLGRRVEGLAAVSGDARADAAHDGRVDGDAGDDGLAFGERGEFLEELAARALDRLGDGVLVYGVDDAHDDLRHALREHVLVELAGPLRDEPDADAELAPLGEYLLEDVRRDHG